MYSIVLRMAYQLLAGTVSPQRRFSMSLDAALAEIQAAKRMRLVPELAGRTFQYQSVHVNEWGQLWPPHTVTLNQDGLVTVAGSAPHGEWKITNDAELKLSFHYKGDPAKAVTNYFAKVPGADAWAAVRCRPEWAAFIVPKTLVGSACIEQP